MRETVRQIVGEVVGHDASLMDTVLHRPASPKGFDCLKSVIGHFTNNCYSFNKVSLITDLVDRPCILYLLNDF